jgi:hypothetical protein
MKMGRAARNRAAMKRRAQRTKYYLALRRFAWRLTAFWCWAHVLFRLISRDPFSQTEAHVSSVAYQLLITVGFTPSNPHLLPFISKLFWILCITHFSSILILGLAIYIVSVPIWLPLRIIFRKQYRAAELKSIAETKPKEQVNPTVPVAKLSIALILIWFVLYGSSTAKIPLVAALVVTGALLGERVYSAFVYTTMIELNDGGMIATITKMPFNYLLGFVQKIGSGEIRTNDQFESWVRAMKSMLWLLRRISAYIYGKAGRRRAALLVLFKYMGNLAILGFLTILFWALAIKLYKAPLPISLPDALLASASHVIPGVPDPDGIKVGLGIQAGASLTAWALFVLYAGPVASMFPMFQEKYVKEMASHSNDLWAGRLLLYRLTDAITRILKSNEVQPQLSELPAEKTDNSSQEPLHAIEGQGMKG